MDWMIHDSFEKEYRNPSGAIICGRTVNLKLKLIANEAVEDIRLFVIGESGIVEKYLMQKIDDLNGQIIYEIKFNLPEKAQLIWYYFSASKNGQVYYYGRKSAAISGEGAIYRTIPPAYQITVYDAETKTPAWLKETLVYQIFVDRFYNGNPDKKIMNPKKDSLIHANWEDDPFYIKDPDTKAVVRWDFFGGNLEGIIKKLSYLEDLGIKCIYLNPIFESASNHKYDTADYKKVDGMFGDSEILKKLCEKAGEKGIAIILDGVFSHTGSDSIYFNKNNTYDSLGAYQSKDSPYYNWYKFKNYPESYDSWWGFTELPNVNEMENSYLDFIIKGENSVLKKWLGLGVKGWRLDVADELPEAFIKTFWENMKAIDSESVLIGEIWEDASNKISYGARRNYLLGKELDSVMSYPFREILINFLNKKSNARETHLKLKTLCEHYPVEYFYSVLNLLGSHDTTRIFTELDENIKKMKLAILWQMTFPGVPYIYYGDEAGATGGKDPLNRKTFPWGRENDEVMAWYKRLILIRDYYEVFKTGNWQSFYQGEHVYGFLRYSEKGKDAFGKEIQDNFACVVFNTNAEAPAEVSVKISDFLEDGTMLDVFSDYKEMDIEKGIIKVHLDALEGKVLVLNRWNREKLEKRRTGILLHPISLPSKYGIGDFGENAYRFVDFLKAGGQKMWQILPLNPPDSYNSPYQCFSGFAGNILLIDLENLAKKGCLEAYDIKNPPGFSESKIDYDQVKRYKEKLLKKAFENFIKKEDASLKENFRKFCIKKQYWLEDYALFQALKKRFKGETWNKWEKNIMDRKPEEMIFWKKELEIEILREKFWQFIFYEQWQALKAYAGSQSIEIIGDLPIYMALDSADVWANKHLFKLDDAGNPEYIAGVPPDYFSKTGQLWGNPVYDWKANKKENYDWWSHRIAELNDMVDFIRIDHFRGFADYWEVEATEKTAEIGTWMSGPGFEFFDKIEEKIGKINFWAENLGNLSDEARALKKELGFPGMKVLQVMLENSIYDEWSLELEEKNEIFYTGTHDNNTLLGWYLEKTGEEFSLAQEKKIWDLIEKVYESEADTIIVPLQDYLLLEASCRMNVPGIADGNWTWRAGEKEFSLELENKLKHLCEKYYR